MLNNSEQLKKIRKERKLTIQAVCDGANIPIRTYQNYEYGKREISAEALYKLAEFYGVTTDYLLGMEENKDLIETIANMFKLSNASKALLAAYLYMDESDRANLLESVQKLTNTSEKK